MKGDELKVEREREGERERERRREDCGSPKGGE
jgi:hypothetical protein